MRQSHQEGLSVGRRALGLYAHHQVAAGQAQAFGQVAVGAVQRGRLDQRLGPDLAQELAQEVVHRHRHQRAVHLLHEALLQEQIDSGIITAEQAKHAQHKNLVTKALGIDPTVEPEVREYEVRPGDIYLLCSDGLCDMVEDGDISMTLEALGANLKLAAQQLVQMANDNGGKDNVSVILVRVLREYPAPRGFFGLFK